MNFESQLFQYLENLKNNLRTQPMFLGGTASWSGGIGGPPGGFIGYLPQTRVAYDFGESATLGTPTSGMSLWDNLNHIRYRIQQLEDSGIPSSGVSSTLIVEENGNVVASGVYILNFVGATVNETGTGEITITIASSGTTLSSGINVNEFANVTSVAFSGATVSDLGDGEVLVTIDVPTPSGSGDMYKSVYDTNNDGIIDVAENVSWSGVTNKPSSYPPDSHTHDDRYYTEIELTTSGQASVHWGNITNVPSIVGGSGIGEAPLDGITYGRCNGEWVESVSGLSTAGDDTCLLSDGIGNTYWGYPLFYVNEEDGNPSGGVFGLIFPNNTVTMISGYAHINFTTTSEVSTIDSSTDPFWFIDGHLEVYQNIGPTFIIPRNCTIVAVYAWCKTPGTSGNTVVDVNKNGTTIFTTQSSRPSLAYNATTPAKSNIPDIVALSENDILTLDIDSVAIGAKDLTVLIALEHALAPEKLPRQAVFTVLETIDTNVGKIKLYNITGQTITLEKVFISVGTAPQGNSIIVDINKNDSTIFTSQGNRPVIASGLTTGYTTNLNITAWEDGSYLTMDIDQIGSTVAGSDLTCIVVGR